MYRHRVVAYQDSYFDAFFTIVFYSASATPATSDTIAGALESGMIGAFNTPQTTLAPASVEKSGASLSTRYWNGSEYQDISLDFTISMTDTVTEV